MGRAEAMTQYVEKVKDIQFIETNKNKEADCYNVALHLVHAQMLTHR